MEAAARLADTVLLCYRASDVASLKAVADEVSFIPIKKLMKCILNK